jgi:dipeptidyl aminopeptidase/acylaminoacyl peptidase
MSPNRSFFGLLSLGLICSAALGAAAARAALIPRSLLFAPMGLHDPNISPDGRLLAYLAPDASSEDKLWIRSVSAESRRPLSSARHGGIASYRWTADSRHILFEQDEDGDELFHVYIVDVDSNKVRDLTPYPGVKAQNILTSPLQPKEVLVGLNLRDPKVFDLYRIDLASGRKTLVAQNPGDVLSFAADAHLQVQGATAFDSSTGDTVIRIRDQTRRAWRDLTRWRFEDSLMFGQVSGGSAIVGFGPSDKSLYVVSAAHSATGRLERIDASTGRELEVLAEDSKSDVAFVDDTDGFRPMVMINPSTGQPEAVAFQYMAREWKALDPRVGADLAFLSASGEGFPIVDSRDRADQNWVVRFIGDAAPDHFALFNRELKRLEGLSRDDSPQNPVFARTESVLIEARDGTHLVSYLTRARGDDAAPSPLVLYPHGGPWFRDDGTFDPIVKLLADRGYSVLQVNFRGSIGFGKAFLNAGNHQFGLAMEDDLMDGVQWAIDHKIAIPTRIAVLGVSAGGYATLRALTRNPERFACGVDIVGPSDLGSLLSSFAPWMQAVKGRWIRRIGDVVEDQALRRELSPLYEASKIRVPLLIGQGARDPRVPIEQSNKMVDAVRSNGIAVSYIVYPDEGHGFGRPANNLDFFGRAEEFLANYLHGDAEPWTAISGATPQVR